MIERNNPKDSVDGKNFYHPDDETNIRIAELNTEADRLAELNTEAADELALKLYREANRLQYSTHGVSYYRN